ncbi:MAG: hypothetical protein SPH68_08480 [Candidatus Borkfalkiaceae bacterium]|nr:hypothetical protein [Clostridia bacterium]MDY6224176.1 hypothetical protein [Christensenellaceae bacterium]
MQLNKDFWTKADGEEFQKYLLTFSKGEEKGAWEKRIANTALPAIAVPCKETDRIVRCIAKGNFLSFLNLELRENHTNVLINGKLIGKIKDFSEMQTRLIAYDKRADNWAATDCIQFTFTSENKEKFFRLAAEMLKDAAHTFVRRQGLIILLKLTAFPEYIGRILRAADSLEGETEYYVNMANAWLICECFIRARNKTLAYLLGGVNGNGAPKLNAFTMNKAISKCRESFRVSAEDKQALLRFRK